MTWCKVPYFIVWPSWARPAARCPPTFAKLHPEVPWAQIVAFRNVVLHHYFGLDLELVWTIITEHVDKLRSTLESILDSLTD